jgi:hypothetical protein
LSIVDCRNKSASAAGASQKMWRRDGFQVMLSEAKHPNPPEDSSLRSE